MQANLNIITEQEKKWAKDLPGQRSVQYQLSRGYVRRALADLWDKDPLSIPLESPPNSAPILPDGWGHLSFSHCLDALLIGWSPHQIGVDIERIDRNMNAKKIANRYFCEAELNLINQLKEEDLKDQFLSYWTAKEAAIKWQRGSIANDLRRWVFYQHKKMAIHNEGNQKITINEFKFCKWQIAIAYNLGLKPNKPILCSSYQPAHNIFLIEAK